MNQKLPTPAVPILARIKGDTVEEMTDWLIDYYNQQSIGFNYVRGTRIIKHAYRGFHHLDALVSACDAEKHKTGRPANRDLVKNVAPLAFSRSLQVFDLPARRFAFGHRQAGFRVPFFFVEDGCIKLYFVQPTKSLELTHREMCMIVTIYKRYLLDTEFFGEKSDIEFVEASAPKGQKDRLVRAFNLSEFDLWSEAQLSDRLTMIGQALDRAENSPEVKRRRRLPPKNIPDMPLFG